MASGEAFGSLLLCGAGGLGLCVVLARFEQECRQAVEQVLTLVYGPFEAIHEGLIRIRGGIQAWLRDQVAQESVREGDGPLMFIIGALIYTLLTCVFIACDWGMLVKTYEAMGMDEGGDFALNKSMSILSAGTLICVALFWGMVLLDLMNVTHLAPWRRVLPNWGVWALAGLSLVMIGFAVFLGVTGGFWRAAALDLLTHIQAEEAAGASSLSQMSSLMNGAGSVNMGAGSQAASASPEASLYDPNTAWIRQANLMGIAGLSTFTAVASGYGVVAASKFLVLFAVALVMAVVALTQVLFWLCRLVLTPAMGLVRAFAGLLIAIGHWVLAMLRGVAELLRRRGLLPETGQTQARQAQDGQAGQQVAGDRQGAGGNGTGPGHQTPPNPPGGTGSGRGNGGSGRAGAGSAARQGNNGGQPGTSPGGVTGSAPSSGQPAPGQQGRARQTTASAGQGGTQSARGNQGLQGAQTGPATPGPSHQPSPQPEQAPAGGEQVAPGPEPQVPQQAPHQQERNDDLGFDPFGRR